ncbi:hypothetical protein GCM10011512_03550 [Tersicoccus solisilvae]|uniref:Uncharacterized protein n=1 Tax=Tersicoccus solisilvae TaxID=1882339 RepID=A0ABQ1NLG3_9MICC|nr:hypothetical protein [Tersicoccus solisilvae]GGC80145.1 hypothetical protein GCM10011512_03550 [Tersicoccus solisilvae]
MRDEHAPPAGQEPPRWGQRIDAPLPHVRRELVGRELVAYRRMARGLSFSALVLGLLLGTGGLTATGPARIVLLVLAGLLVAAGVSGYVLVNTGRLPRHAGVSEPSRVRTVLGTTAGRVAVVLAVVGLLLLVASTVVVPLVEDTPAENAGTSLVLACLMSALALFIAAAIAVTVAVLSEGRDDEPGPDQHGGATPGATRRGGGPVGYRSDWITRPHR